MYTSTPSPGVKRLTLDALKIGELYSFANNTAVAIKRDWTPESDNVDYKFLKPDDLFVLLGAEIADDRFGNPWPSGKEGDLAAVTLWLLCGEQRAQICFAARIVRDWAAEGPGTYIAPIFLPFIRCVSTGDVFDALLRLPE